MKGRSCPAGAWCALTCRPMSRYIRRISWFNERCDLNQTDRSGREGKMGMYARSLLTAVRLLAALDKYGADEWTSDGTAVALQEGEWNGKRYSVPTHEWANAISVHQALFAQAGIPVPHDLKGAWTWSQLRDIGLKLTDRSGGTT